MTASKKVDLETKIKQVVVLLDGAKVTRTGKTELTKGFQQVHIKGLTRKLRKDSVRVSGKGKGSLGSIDVETKYQEEVAHEKLNQLKKEEKKIQKELDTLNEKLTMAIQRREQLNVLSDRFSNEFPLWFASGEAKLETLSKFMEFEEKQNEENLTNRQKLEDEIEKLQKKLQTIQAEINDYHNQTRVEQTREIIIGVDVKETGAFQFEINYQTSGVHWQPIYDVNLKQEEANIKSQAQIRNNTLEDWKNVELEVSTAIARPVKIVKPNPYYIDIYQPRVSDRAGGGIKRRAMKMASVAPGAPPSPMEKEEAKPEPELIVEEAEIKESPAGVQSYSIPGKWTIPSDGNYHPVTLISYDLKTEKEFYWNAVDPLGVVAIDKITNGDAILLPGKAKVYSEGEFIGETSIDQIAPQEEFKLGAREELRIKAEKKLLSRVREKAGLIKGKRTIEYCYELEFKNFRKDDSVITIKDVIPYSKSERIKVNWIECSQTPEDENLGIYTWKIKMKPESEVKITYRYDVTWEKDYQIQPSLP
ncbi:MAG: mucoidy inhibitor MuiA family protein [Candidatus Heimdallarchaeota archaeon]|nr:mucoidy inhibitor MuiA family protein [Candidatus Heimdallarchaeota archaeon]